jgi:hypothetical protein
MCDACVNLHISRTLLANQAGQRLKNTQIFLKKMMPSRHHSAQGGAPAPLCAPKHAAIGFAAGLLVLAFFPFLGDYRARLMFYFGILSESQATNVASHATHTPPFLFVKAVIYALATLYSTVIHAHLVARPLSIRVGGWLASSQVFFESMVALLRWANE